jgi:acetoacetyl-CoA synthetase
MTKPSWSPDAAARAATRLAAFMQRVDPALKPDSEGYGALWRWSIDQPEAFWKSVWDFGGVIGSSGTQVLARSPQGMRFAKWFPEARPNFAENLLRPSANPESNWGLTPITR